MPVPRELPKIAERFIMTRRPLRPTFSLTDKTRLVEAMRAANELAGLYQSSTPSSRNDATRQHCEELRKAIHTLITSFTGDPEYFSYRYSPAPAAPTPEELDGLATTLFNAYHEGSQSAGMKGFSEIEARGLPNEAEEWRALRSALELIPDTMFSALRNLTRQSASITVPFGDKV